MSASSESSRTSSRTGLILLLGALAALGPFAIDTYLPAFSVMATDLGTNTARIGLSLSAYFLGICLGQLAYGPILDRFGRRTPLLLGLGVFVVASGLCALATSVEMLIALRFLQALGGCAGMVAGRALVRDLFPHEAAQVFSSLMLVMGVAPVVAPSLGGLLTETVGWRSIFLFLSAVSLVVAVFIAWKLPTVHVPDQAQSLHPAEVLKGYLRIFEKRDFRVYGVGGSLVSAGLFAYITGSPAVYMDVLGFSRTAFAWIFAFNAIGLISASQVNRWWLKRSTSQAITASTLKFQMLATIGLLVSGWIGFAPGVVVLVWVFMFCQGIVMPNISALAMHPFDRNAGSASALLGALGMAMGALLSAMVSLLPTGSAMPMAAGMGAAAIGGVLLMGWFGRKAD